MILTLFQEDYSFLCQFDVIPFHKCKQKDLVYISTPNCLICTYSWNIGKKNVLGTRYANARRSVPFYFRATI